MSTHPKQILVDQQKPNYRKKQQQIYTQKEQIEAAVQFHINSIYKSKNHAPFSSHQFTPDEILQSISGSTGCFQITAAILAAIQFNLSGILFYGVAFLQKYPNFECFSQYTDTYAQCSRQQACQSGNYTTDYKYYNFISHFNLQCKSDAQIGLIGASYFLGFLVGSMIFPRLADIIGRRPIQLLGMIIHIALTLLLILLHDVTALYFILVLLGFRTPMNTQIAYIHLLEFVGEKVRNKYASFLMIIDGAWALIIPLYYQLFLDFRYLFWFSIGYTIIGIVCSLFYFPQSPRYCITRQKYEQAKKIYYTVRLRNKRFGKDVIIDDATTGDGINFGPLRSYLDIKIKGENPYIKNEEMISGTTQIQDNQKESLVSVDEEGDNSSKSSSSNTNCINFLKGGSKIWVPLIIMSINWFTVNFVSYGIMIGIKYLKSDIFYLGLAVGFAEVFSYLVSGLSVDRCGRKKTLIILFAITTADVFIYQFLHREINNLYAIVAIVLIGKLCITADFAVVYLLTSESFPTAFRATTFGITNAVGRLGGIFAPLVDELQKENFMMIFGIVLIVSILCSLFLSETLGSKLKDTLEDMKDNERQINNKKLQRKDFDEDDDIQMQNNGINEMN